MLSEVVGDGDSDIDRDSDGLIDSDNEPESEGDEVPVSEEVCVGVGVVLVDFVGVSRAEADTLDDAAPEALKLREFDGETDSEISSLNEEELLWVRLRAAVPLKDHDWDLGEVELGDTDVLEERDCDTESDGVVECVVDSLNDSLRVGFEERLFVKLGEYVKMLLSPVCERVGV
jgi:hypothetical protein